MNESDTAIVELIETLVWQFDTELSGGQSPDWNTYLARCPTTPVKGQLVSLMIQCEHEHCGWDPERIKNRLSLFASFNPPGSFVLDILREVYWDRVENGERPQLSEFEAFGFAADELQLLGPGDTLYLGRSVGQWYRVEERLGKGGFGVVYRGFDAKERQPVAIKTIVGGCDEQKNMVAQVLLFQEVSALVTLTHVGIPRVIDLVVEPNLPLCVVRQLIDGPTLSEMVKEGPLDPLRAAELVAVIADVVQLAHERGVIFRDLSPRNVLVDHDGCPYLIDPALAISPRGQQHRRGEKAGTAGYMSPESKRGDTSQIDRRADVWAIGALLFELLAGKSLFASGSQAKDIAEEDPLEADPSLLSGIPIEVRAICSKCLTRELIYRYQTAAEIADDLRHFLGKEPSGAEKELTLSANRRLIAWRLGMAFGAICQKLPGIRIGGQSPSRGELESVLAAAELLEHAVGMGRTIVRLLPFSGALQQMRDLYSSGLELTTDQEGQVEEFKTSVWGRLGQSRKLIGSRLKEHGDDVVELFEFAGNLREVDHREASRLWSCDSVAGLPSECTHDFFSAVANKREEEKIEEAIDVLNKNVEQWLHNKSSGHPSAERMPTEYRSALLSLIAESGGGMDIDWLGWLAGKSEVEIVPIAKLLGVIARLRLIVENS